MPQNLSLYMTRIPLFLFCIFWALSFPATAAAQEIRAGASVDSLSAGAVFEFRIDFPDARIYNSVIYPDSTFFGRDFFIRNKEVTRRGRTATYELQFFGFGDAVLDRLAIRAVQGADTLLLAVPPVAFGFRTVLQPADNLRPFKPIFVFPMDIYGLIMAFILAILAAISAWHLYTKYFRKAAPPPPPPPVMPPVFDNPLSRLEKGIRELETGFADGSISTEAIYVKLSFLLREYYERIYSFPALEQTSREVLKGLKHRKIVQAHYDTVSHLLTTADMVKFAGFSPDNSDIQSDLISLREAAAQLRKSNSGLVQQLEMEHIRRYRATEPDQNKETAAP